MLTTGNDSPNLVYYVLVTFSDLEKQKDQKLSISLLRDIRWVLSVTTTKNTTATHTHKNNQNQTFLTITEIHDPNFITSKIQNPDPKIDENRKPL